MNWFKKQVNKIFATEDKEQGDKTTSPPQPKSEPTEDKRENFSFPLIPDDETNLTLTTEQESTYENEGRVFNIEGWQQDKQEIPGLREDDICEMDQPKLHELLAARSKKVYQRFDDSTFTQRQPLKKRQNMRIEPIVEKEDLPISPPSHKIPFKAEDVPSPVHGFIKPSPMSEKIAQRMQTQQNDALYVEPKPVRKIKLDPEPIANRHVTDEELATPTILREEPIVEVPKERNKHEVVEVIKPPLQEPKNQDVNIIEAPALNSDSSTEKEPQEKVMPFNVIMLKSDKAKQKRKPTS